MTPTARSMAALRRQGYEVARVERWNPFAHVRQDVFNFGDLLACRPSPAEVALVQVTVASCMAARRAKILGIPAARRWIESGGVVRLHGWKAPTKTERKWTLHDEAVSLASFQE